MLFHRFRFIEISSVLSHCRNISSGEVVLYCLIYYVDDVIALSNREMVRARQKPRIQFQIAKCVLKRVTIFNNGTTFSEFCVSHYSNITFFDYHTLNIDQRYLKLSNAIANTSTSLKVPFISNSRFSCKLWWADDDKTVTNADKTTATVNNYDNSNTNSNNAPIQVSWQSYRLWEHLWKKYRGYWCCTMISPTTRWLKLWTILITVIPIAIVP